MKICLVMLFSLAGLWTFQTGAGLSAGDEARKGDELLFKTPQAQSRVDGMEARLRRTEKEVAALRETVKKFSLQQSRRLPRRLRGKPGATALGPLKPPQATEAVNKNPAQEKTPPEKEPDKKESDKTKPPEPVKTPAAK